MVKIVEIKQILPLKFFLLFDRYILLHRKEVSSTSSSSLKIAMKKECQKQLSEDECEGGKAEEKYVNNRVNTACDSIGG